MSSFTVETYLGQVEIRWPHEHDIALSKLHKSGQPKSPSLRRLPMTPQINPRKPLTYAVTFLEILSTYIRSFASYSSNTQALHFD